MHLLSGSRAFFVVVARWNLEKLYSLGPQEQDKSNINHALCHRKKQHKRRNLWPLPEREDETGKIKAKRLILICSQTKKIVYNFQLWKTFLFSEQQQQRKFPVFLFLQFETSVIDRVQIGLRESGLVKNGWRSDNFKHCKGHQCARYNYCDSGICDPISRIFPNTCSLACLIVHWKTRTLIEQANLIDHCFRPNHCNATDENNENETMFLHSNDRESWRCLWLWQDSDRRQEYFEMDKILFWFQAQQNGSQSFAAAASSSFCKLVSCLFVQATLKL